MKRWIKFFFGTPNRFITTALAVTALGVIQYFAPGTLFSVAVSIVEELGPLLNFALYYGLVFFFLFLGFHIILKPLFGKKK